MGRPPNRDTAAVLADARAVFRARGYGHTSLKDIERATGLHPGSLYKAYGSKDGLFAAALGSYNEVVVAGRIAEFLVRTDDPMAGILAYFSTAVEGPGDPVHGGPPGMTGNDGCLLTNSAVEASAFPPALRAGVADGLHRIEEAFTTALQAALACGQIPPDRDPEALATALLALYQGVLVLARFGTEPGPLGDRTEAAINALVGYDKATHKTTNKTTNKTES